MYLVASKIVLGLLLLIVSFVSIINNYTSAQVTFTTDCSDPANMGFSTQCSDYNPNVIGKDATEASASLIDTAKKAVNRVLGMLALVALIILLIGGFQMLIAAGDEDKYKKGFKILKEAAIGLAFIAFAWLFVSLVFWLIDLIAK